MTKRLPCPPAPGPLEDYAAQFDSLFGSLAQRRGFRACLQGLLLPRDRNKTLTALAGTEPVVGAQHAAVQGLQWFLSESTWDHDQVNQHRLKLLLDDPATAPHDQGVLVIDDSGDRKAGTRTAHVARQCLGSVGKTDNGIVAVTSLWADERAYWPAHVTPYTPAGRLPKGKRDPGFRTKPQQAAELVQAARTAGIGFRAVVADCFYGDNEGFCAALGAAKVAYVLAVKPRKGAWAPADATHTPQEAARQLAWTSPAEPGDWTPVTRRFRDGHTQTWWAADAALPAAGWGPDRRIRLVVATTDPATLPKLTTWYLVTNLPAPTGTGGHARPSRPPTWPSWCACTACATGSSRATSRSSTSSAGPTSRSAPTARSAATGSWSVARSASAGGRGSPSPPPNRPPPSLPPPPRGPRGGSGPTRHASQPVLVSWPVTLRRVRGWLTPWVVLGRWWRAWSTAAPPAQLRLLLDAAHAGQPLHLYLPP